MIEHFFSCPYCWKTISVLIDPSVAEQHYVEDCENCCNPIEIEVVVKDEELLHFQANKVGQ